jgi:hypothetical protein
VQDPAMIDRQHQRGQNLRIQDTTGARRSATRGFSGRGGLQKWPKELGDGGHASRPSILAPSGGGCTHGHLALIRRRNPTSRSAAPLHTPHQHQCQCQRQDQSPCRCSVSCDGLGCCVCTGSLKCARRSRMPA